MSEKKNLDENGNSHTGLRDAAEGKLGKFQELSSELKNKATEEIIHELRVHQIELEMQNEELKRTRLESEKSRDKYQDLYDFAPVGYFTLTSKGIIMDVNLTGASLLGIPRLKLFKMRFAQFVAVESEDNWYKHIMTVIKQQDKLSCVLTLKREDGSSFYARLESIRMDAPAEQQGDTNGGHAIRIAVSDITAARKAEETEKLLATAIEHAAEGIVITDPTGIIQYVNPAEESITGYGRDELIGRKANIFKSDKHDESFYRELWETITAGKVWSGRFINKKKDGAEYHEEASISPVHHKSGNLTNFVAVRHDVTKQNALQEQLFQSQKMEAIGTLAGGFAHDFKNMLQVVLGFLDLIEMNKEVPKSLQNDLKRIRKAAASGAELVKGMLVFSRKSSVKLEPLNLNELVEQIQSLLARTIPKMIEIELVLAHDLSSINGDSTQIEQILMNLAINAADAMPDGGRLTIGTRNIMLDEQFCRIYPGTNPGRYVQLSVTDTGIGMDQKTVSRIFEPFFTTKEKGKGTGLGLSMVYGIVEQHGGRITCYSEPSVGTKFKIYFPAIQEAPDVKEAEAKEPPKGRSETILVVDDDSNITEIASRMLREANYKVITASNGKEALDLYEKRGEEIKLVMLDLIMPVMGGIQCLQGLLSMNPKVKALIASGYTFGGATKEFLDAGAKGCLDKPFNRLRMLEMIRKFIDED